MDISTHRIVPNVGWGVTLEKNELWLHVLGLVQSQKASDDSSYEAK